MNITITIKSHANLVRCDYAFEIEIDLQMHRCVLVTKVIS